MLKNYKLEIFQKEEMKGKDTTLNAYLPLLKCISWQDLFSWLYLLFSVSWFIDNQEDREQNLCRTIMRRTGKVSIHNGQE